ncbi:MAG TPA: T9SS type A sorting domain-containing protein, partial [Ohtaekwangia sp.]
LGGAPLNAASTTITTMMKAGSYKILTDVELEEYPITAIGETRENLDVQVYPNPSRGEFIVKLKQQAPVRSISVVDLRGVPQRFTAEQDIINISQLPAGLYLLKVTDQQGKFITQKIVKE